MKKLKRTRSKKILSLVIIAVILVAAASVGYYYMRQNSKSSIESQENAKTTTEVANEMPDPVPATPDEEADASQTKQSTVDKAKTPSPSPTALGVSFTAANQAGNTLQVRLKIDQIISQGTCTLTLKKDGKTVTKTASVYASASLSTCKGFDVPLSELSAGTWQLSATVSSNSLKGSATSQTEIK